jgi:hypothetical protein
VTEHPDGSKGAPMDAVSSQPPTSGVVERGLDPRVQGAWRVWLESLATDAEAATAAAHLYGELPDETRDAWLDALEEDAPKLGVPNVAVYGPLLAIEREPERLERIRLLAGESLEPVSMVRRALLGTEGRGTSGELRRGEGRGVRVAALVFPLYLDFVRLLVCRFTRETGFEWVRQDPIVPDDDAPVSGTVIDGVKLYASSTVSVVDELAHAVLAHRRQGKPLPHLLQDCADLFSARLA